MWCDVRSRPRSSTTGPIAEQVVHFAGSGHLSPGSTREAVAALDRHLGALRPLAARDMGVMENRARAATSQKSLQIENGSDGTRTPDLRRDRPDVSQWPARWLGALSG
jgi:hypothetical protein